MKLKYYLNGFGIGIIFATLLLSIAFYAGREKEQSISKQEVERLAAAYGMIYPEESTTEQDSTTEERKNQETTKETVEQGSTEEISEQESIGETSEQVSSGETEVSGEQQTILDTRIVEKTITVPEGMYASAIAKLLEEAGIIESAQEFSRYLIRRGYTKRLQPGIYTFIVGTDFDTIAGRLLWES